MKRCAKCDTEYDDAYDGCPNCARQSNAAESVQKSSPAVRPGFVIALVLLIGLVLMICLWGNLAGTSTQEVTMAKFNQVENGMSAEQVFAIMGSSGTKTVDQEIAGYTGQIYQWQNPGGSNMIVQFQNGKVVQKAQAGLR